MGSAALAIFRGIFLGPGGWAGWFLRGFGVREARGGSFGVTKPKRDMFILRLQNKRFFDFCIFGRFRYLPACFAKNINFLCYTNFYIADRAFFDLIFSFWHKPSEAKNRKKCFREKTCFLKKVNFAFFCPSRFFGKKSQIEIFRVFFKIVQ
jgi:hypothetical protein